MDARLPPKERLNKLFDQGAGSVTIQASIPIQRYFRSGQEMIRMATVYSDEKHYESAYVLLTKFIRLFLNELKSHPQYKQASPKARAANRESVKVALSKAESIKCILEEKYTIEHAKWKDEQAKLKILEEERLEQERLKEKHKKEMAEKAHLDQEKAQMDYFEEQMNRKQLEQERKEIEAKFSGTATSQDANSSILIPFLPPPPDTNSTGTYIPPTEPMPPQTNSTLTPQVPSVDRSTKPRLPETTNVMTTKVLPSSKYGLRFVISPHDLPDKFMRYAKLNTDRNVETCGILFGNLSQNKFVITHVLIPHQTGTSESCATTREEDLWEFQEQCNGICLGWIHTHPSQTAFLSSVDLHTHYPYQCLMAESVAIVCSGKFNEVGYFMISPGRGMNEIGGCSKQGHHPHSTVPPLFETCDHVDVSASHNVTIVDWRNK